MTRYAKVLNGEILEYRADAPIGNQSQLAEGKPRWLPVEVTDPAFDPVTQVRTGPVLTVLSTKVKEVYTVRSKTAGERNGMIDAKDAEIEAAFVARCDAPIDVDVGGETYTWHADAAARENIMGVVLMIAVGLPIPDPRPWTPKDGEPVMLAHSDFVGIGAAIAARKDALYLIKKAKQAEVAELNDAAAIADYDVEAGW